MPQQEEKIIVVSNRLPITIGKKNGNWIMTPSSGGLVTGLSGLKSSKEFTWVGWPGFEVNDNEKDDLKVRLQEDWDCSPVFLPADVAAMFYEKASNELLWPIIHDFNDIIQFNEDTWQAYRDANKLFAVALMELLTPNTLLWIHDYHLLLLPKLIRDLLNENSINNVRVGFFLHTPFPSKSMFSLIPVGGEIVSSLLAADLIGFHTKSYKDRFLTVSKGLIEDLEVYDDPGLKKHDASLIRSFNPSDTDPGFHLTTVGVFPIGISPSKFLINRDTIVGPNPPPSSSVIKVNIESRFKDKTVILGIDRLDYIKGLTYKLKIMEKLLEMHPDIRDNVVLLQIAIPTRESVSSYITLKKSIMDHAMFINSRYSTLTNIPIHIYNHSISFDEITILYSIADICLITSLRDGMNLVAFEYLTLCSPTGRLLLSKYTGAADYLPDSILIDPYSIDSTAETLYNAINSPQSLPYDYESLNAFVNKNTASLWGINFMGALTRVPSDPAPYPGTRPTLPSLFTQIYDKIRNEYKTIVANNHPPSVPITRNLSGSELDFSSPLNIFASLDDNDMINILGHLFQNRSSAIPPPIVWYIVPIPYLIFIEYISIYKTVCSLPEDIKKVKSGLIRDYLHSNACLYEFNTHMKRIFFLIELSSSHSHRHGLIFLDLIIGAILLTTSNKTHYISIDNYFISPRIEMSSSIKDPSFHNPDIITIANSLYEILSNSIKSLTDEISWLTLKSFNFRNLNSIEIIFSIFHDTEQNESNAEIHDTVAHLISTHFGYLDNPKISISASHNSHYNNVYVAKISFILRPDLSVFCYSLMAVSTMLFSGPAFHDASKSIYIFNSSNQNTQLILNPALFKLEFKACHYDIRATFDLIKVDVKDLSLLTVSLAIGQLLAN